MPSLGRVIAIRFCCAVVGRYAAGLGEQQDAVNITAFKSGVVETSLVFFLLILTFERATAVRLHESDVTDRVGDPHAFQCSIVNETAIPECDPAAWLYPAEYEDIAECVQTRAGFIRSAAQFFILPGMR